MFLINHEYYCSLKMFWPFSVILLVSKNSWCNYISILNYFKHSTVTEAAFNSVMMDMLYLITAYC